MIQIFLHQPKLSNQVFKTDAEIHLACISEKMQVQREPLGENCL